jgi:hypothetical protein
LFLFYLINYAVTVEAWSNWQTHLPFTKVAPTQTLSLIKPTILGHLPTTSTSRLLESALNFTVLPISTKVNPHRAIPPTSNSAFAFLDLAIATVFIFPAVAKSSSVVLTSSLRIP